MDSLTIEDWQLVKVKKHYSQNKLKGRKPILGEVYVETFAKGKELLQAMVSFHKETIKLCGNEWQIFENH